MESIETGFNYDRNEKLLNDIIKIPGSLNAQYLVFDAGQSRPGDDVGVCIDAVEERGYSYDSFYFYPEAHKYQINIDLRDIDQNLSNNND